MKVADLGDVAEFVMGQAPPGKACNLAGEGTPFVKAGEFTGQRPIIREWTTKPLKYGSRTDVFVCVVGATAGKINLGIDCAIGRSVAAVKPRASELSQFYLYRFLQTQVQRLRGNSQGVAQGVITREMLHSLQIPLPPLPEQKRIAAILDAADALRAKQRESIEQLDSLTQATFLEMFGDPVTNPKGWPREALHDVGRVITGNTPSRGRAEFYGDAIEWIKSDNINTPSFTLTNASEGLSELGRLEARIAPKGSVLITCIAGSRHCIGNAAVADREVAFNQQINAFVPGPRLTLWYAFGFFLTGKSLVQASSTNSMKGMVSKSAFNAISMPVSPLPLQTRFASIVESIEVQKTRLTAHLAELDALFASLQSRAFNGELVA